MYEEASPPGYCPTSAGGDSRMISEAVWPETAWLWVPSVMVSVE